MLTSGSATATGAPPVMSIAATASSAWCLADAGRTALTDTAVSVSIHAVSVRVSAIFDQSGAPHECPR